MSTFKTSLTVQVFYPFVIVLTRFTGNILMISFRVSKTTLVDKSRKLYFMLVGNAQRHDPNNFPWNWDYFNLFMCTDYENAQISGKSNSWYNFDMRKNMGTKYVKTQSAIICFALLYFIN